MSNRNKKRRLGRSGDGFSEFSQYSLDMAREQEDYPAMTGRVPASIGQEIDMPNLRGGFQRVPAFVRNAPRIDSQPITEREQQSEASTKDPSVDVNSNKVGTSTQRPGGRTSTTRRPRTSSSSTTKTKTKTSTLTDTGTKTETPSTTKTPSQTSTLKQSTTKTETTTMIQPKRRKGGSKSGSSYVSYARSCSRPINGTIKFKTGIKSGLIVNPNEPVNKEDWSMLFFQSGELFDLSATAADTTFYDYVLRNIFPEVERKVQDNLNYSYDFTYVQFADWFSAVSTALQIHYMCDSIKAVAEHKDCTNRGELFLRSLLNSQIRLRLQALADMLAREAIPPMVLETVRMAYQSYKFADLPTSPHYRLNFRNLFNTNVAPGTGTGDSLKYGSISTELIDKAIDDLRVVSSLGNKIYQALPEWHVPDNCLPGSFTKATYDLNFRTFWYNNDICYTNAANAVKHTREGSDLKHSFRYYLFKDWTNYDGMYFAMCSLRLSTDANAGLTRPGIWNPVWIYPDGTPNTSRVNALYYEGSAFYPPAFTNDTQQVWQLFDIYKLPVKIGANDYTEKYNYDGSTHVAQECTFSTFKETVYSAARWLFDY